MTKSASSVVTGITVSAIVLLGFTRHVGAWPWAQPKPIVRVTGDYICKNYWSGMDTGEMGVNALKHIKKTKGEEWVYHQIMNLGSKENFTRGLVDYVKDNCYSVYKKIGESERY